MDIKSVIRDYLFRNCVVNVLPFKTCKLSKCSIEISEDPMFLDNKLPRSNERSEFYVAVVCCVVIS